MIYSIPTHPPTPCLKAPALPRVVLPSPGCTPYLESRLNKQINLDHPHHAVGWLYTPRDKILSGNTIRTFFRMIQQTTYFC